MYIKIPDEIQYISDIFRSNGEKLYIVGGFVRDSVLGKFSLEHNDIDLCSAAKPDKVVKMFKNTNFETDDKNAKFGTVIITGKSRYEYTTFRRENYNLNGEHNPTGVEFVKDIHQDALRRDFTINALYYDVQNQEIVDTVDGLEHIKQKIIACPGSSAESFSQDSERILRMIRFSCSLNFRIDAKTLESAYEFRRGLANLSKTRIRKEFEKMLVCDTFYQSDKESQYAHTKCMIMIGQLGLWEYVLPCVEHIQYTYLLDNKGEHLYNHMLNTLSVCEPNSRLACIVHDVGKIYTKEQTNSFQFSKEWAEIIIDENLGNEGLYYPKDIVSKTKKIVSALDFDRHGFAQKNSVKTFIRENNDVFEKICALKDAIALENTDYSQKSKIANRWKKIYGKMIAEKTPFTLSELDLNGKDIIEAFPKIKIEKIGQLLNFLLDYCLYHPRCNDKTYLISKIKKIISKNPECYFD